MQANNFNIHFLNQFHQECIVYPGKKEQQYKNLLFRQFAGRKNELPCLTTSVAQKLDDSEIVYRLITQLENENIPDYFRLSNVAQKLKRQVSSYVINEHFITTYSKRVLGILKPFIHLIDDFHEKAQQPLLNRLKALQAETNRAKNTSVSSEEADDLIIMMEQFLDYLYDYYNDFNTCIDKDSDGLKGVAVTTYMEQYMINLVSLIEKLMYDTKSAQTLLQSWKTQLANREVQVIYN